jgi:hypothetical protein
VSSYNEVFQASPAGTGGLADLRVEFPRYQIWEEIVRDRTRYVARSQQAGTRPHTLVTADLQELRNGLSAGTGTEDADRSQGARGSAGAVPSVSRGPAAAEAGSA